jgi:glutaminyl-tRNA synthetase
VEVRLYDRLFSVSNPASARDVEDFRTLLNPDSAEILPDGLVEPSLAEARPMDRFQFERLGYFCVDSVDGSPGAPVFNRTVTLRDTWAKHARPERGS